MAKVAPMIVPMIIPIAINLKSKSSNEMTVAIIATRIPNDEIVFEVQKINRVKTVYKFGGIATNKKVKICEAEFSAMIIDKSSNEIFWNN